MNDDSEEIFNKVKGFSKIFKEIIENKTCLDANPFIDNVSNYIGHYMPHLEYVFKYHLLVETILSILSMSGYHEEPFLERFNSMYAIKAPTQPAMKNMEEIRKFKPKFVIETLNDFLNSADNKSITLFNDLSDSSKNKHLKDELLTYIVNVLENTNNTTTNKELTKIYDDCFPKKDVNDQDGGFPTITSALNLASNIAQGNVDDIAEGLVSDTAEPNKKLDTINTEENPSDPDKTCFINTKRDIKLAKTLMNDNVTKLNIKREVENIINSEINKLSKLVLSEKSFDRVLLTSQNPDDVQTIKKIKSVKYKLLHDYVFMVSTNDTKYGDVYSKSFTIQILQNIKLFLINIAKFIVTKSKEHSVYGLNALLLTILQDNVVNGFIRTIARSKQYYEYTNELKFAKRNDPTKIELSLIVFLTFIYYNIASNPKIKSTNRIDLELIHNYLKQTNIELKKQFSKGGLEGGGDKLTTAMSGISDFSISEIENHKATQPVSSYLDPQNRYVDTVVKEYVGSVISSVKKNVYTYDVYQSVINRLNVDAGGLRITILFCVLKMFNTESFGAFLNKLLQDNDILKPQQDITIRPTTALDDNKLVGNDIMLKLFLQKLTSDLNDSEKKFSVEVIQKYTNLISEINPTKIINIEDEIANALRVNVKQTGGGRKWMYRSITIKPNRTRKPNTTSNAFRPKTNTVRTSLRRLQKPRPNHRRKTIHRNRNARQ